MERVAKAAPPGGPAEPDIRGFPVSAEQITARSSDLQVASASDRLAQMDVAAKPSSVKAEPAPAEAGAGSLLPL
jgi:hypothetical protein